MIFLYIWDGLIFLHHSISHNLLDIHFFKYLRCTNFLNVSIFSGVLFFKWFFAFSVFVQYKFSLILFKSIFQAHVYYSSSRWYKTATLRSETALSDTNRRLESSRNNAFSFYIFLLLFVMRAIRRFLTAFGTSWRFFCSKFFFTSRLWKLYTV